MAFIDFPKIRFQFENLIPKKTTLKELGWVGLAGTLSFFVFTKSGLKDGLINLVTNIPLLGPLLGQLFSFEIIRVFFIVAAIFYIKSLVTINLKNGGRDLF